MCKQISDRAAVSEIDPYNAETMAGRPPTKPAPVFGTHLAAIRKERGFTQTQLAKKLGISIDMLTYYERRAKNPTSEFMAKAAKVLGVSVDDFLGGKTTPKRKSGPPSQIEQRLSAVRQLPREKQKVVLQLLDSFLQTNNSTS